MTTTILLTVYLTGTALTTLAYYGSWILDCVVSGRLREPESILRGPLLGMIWPAIPFIFLYYVFTYKPQ